MKTDIFMNSVISKSIQNEREECAKLAERYAADLLKENPEEMLELANLFNLLATEIRMRTSRIG